MSRFGFITVASGLFVLLALLEIKVNAQNQTKPIPRSLTLAQAEDLLIERNLSVVAARYQIETERAAKLIASYKPNPIVTLGLEQVSVYSPIKGSFPRFWNTNPDAGANPVYTFRIDKIWERGGKRELRIEQSDYQLKAAEAQMLDAIRNQIYQLRQAFSIATLARENLILAETIQKEYEQTETLTQAKVELGDQPGVEIYRVRSGRLQFQQAVLQARTAYEQASRDVLNLLGARPEEILPAVSSGANTQVTDNSPSGPALPVSNDKKTQTPDKTQIPDSLRGAPLELIWAFDDRPLVQTVVELRALSLSERPDVQVARQNFKAAESALRLANAQRARDVDIGYEYQRVGNDHSAGVVVQIPLFVYNNQRAAIAQAEAQLKTAEALQRQVELQAMTDVEKAYQSYRTARQMLELYNSQNLAQVEKLHSIATYSYKEGASSLLEMLDAERSYNQAITSYNQARADYQSSLWQLEQAVGHALR